MTLYIILYIVSYTVAFGFIMGSLHLLEEEFFKKLPGAYKKDIASNYVTTGLFSLTGPIGIIVGIATCLIHNGKVKFCFSITEESLKKATEK